MIIANGLISALEKKGGGYDLESGYATRPSSSSWGIPVPCQIIDKRVNRLAIHEGERVREVSFAVYVDGVGFSASEVRVTRGGVELGTFSVISSEDLTAVNQTLINI